MKARRTHQCLGRAIAAPDAVAAAVPAEGVLSGKDSTLAWHPPQRVNAVDMLSAIIFILGFQQCVDFVEVNRVDMSQVGAIAKNRPCGIGYG